MTQYKAQAAQPPAPKHQGQKENKLHLVCSSHLSQPLQDCSLNTAFIPDYDCIQQHNTITLSLFSFQELLFSVQALNPTGAARDLLVSMPDPFPKLTVGSSMSRATCQMAQPPRSAPRQTLSHAQPNPLRQVRQEEGQTICLPRLSAVFKDSV